MSCFYEYLRKREIGINHRKHVRAPLNFLFDRCICTRSFLERNYEEMIHPPLCCTFSKHSSPTEPILAVGYDAGTVSLLKTKPVFKVLATIHDFEDYGHAVFDICWRIDQPWFCVACGDNSYVFDAVEMKIVRKVTSQQSSIKAVDLCPNQPNLVATAGRDGHIRIWDMRAPMQNTQTEAARIEGSSVAYIGNAHSYKEFPKSKYYITRGVTSVLFQDEVTLFSSGNGDGCIKVWDLRKTYAYNARMKSGKAPLSKHHLRYGSIGTGCTGLVFDSTYKNIFGACTDNKIRKYDCHLYSKEPVSIYEGAKFSSFYTKAALSFDDQYLLSGGMENDALVWNVLEKGRKPLRSLKGHEQDVTSVAWHPFDAATFVTCSDDSRVFVWEMQGADPILAGTPTLPNLGIVTIVSSKSPHVQALGAQRIRLPQLLHESSTQRPNAKSAKLTRIKAKTKKSRMAKTNTISKYLVKPRDKKKEEK